MYIVFAMISCYGPPSKDTQPADTETTPTDTTPSPTDTAPAPVWVGLDLGPDGLCLVSADDSYTCITHAGAEYRYSILQAEHLSVGDGFGCALVQGRSPLCSGDLIYSTPTDKDDYSDLQTGATFACAFRYYPHTDIDCWGLALPAYEPSPSHELFAVGPYSICAANYLRPSIHCYTTDGEGFSTPTTFDRLLDLTVGQDRVCYLKETDGYRSWSCGYHFNNTMLSTGSINGLYDPLQIQAASDDTLLCGLSPTGAVECWDLIDIPPNGRLTFPPRPSAVRDFDAHAGVACVLYSDGKVTCLGVPDSTSKIPIYSADFMP